MNRYELKVQAMTEKYGEFAAKYTYYHDDRRLFAKTFDFIIGACKAMEDKDDDKVYEAISGYIDEQCEMFDRIIKRIDGLVYKDHSWQKEE